MRKQPWEHTTDRDEMKVTKRQLRKIIQETVLREQAEDLYVVIGNAGQGRQNAWPSSAEPKAMPQLEAREIADRLNDQAEYQRGSYGSYSSGGWNTMVRYHIKPVAAALNYVSPGNETFIGISKLQDQLGL
jgi:hypothetical protein